MSKVLKFFFFLFLLAKWKELNENFFIDSFWFFMQSCEFWRGSCRNNFWKMYKNTQVLMGTLKFLLFYATKNYLYWRDWAEKRVYCRVYMCNLICKHGKKFGLTVTPRNLEHAAYKLQRNRTQKWACRTSEILRDTVTKHWRCESSNFVVHCDELGGDIRHALPSSSTRDRRAPNQRAPHIPVRLHRTEL